MKRLLAITLGCIITTSTQAEEWKFEKIGNDYYNVHTASLVTYDVTNCSPDGGEAKIFFSCNSDDKKNSGFTHCCRV